MLGSVITLYYIRYLYVNIGFVCVKFINFKLNFHPIEISCNLLPTFTNHPIHLYLKTQTVVRQKHKLYDYCNPVISF